MVARVGRAASGRAGADGREAERRERAARAPSAEMFAVAVLAFRPHGPWSVGQYYRRVLARLVCGGVRVVRARRGVIPSGPTGGTGPIARPDARAFVDPSAIAKSFIRFPVYCVQRTR